MSIFEIDPKAIRERLTTLRREGHGWGSAWLLATGRVDRSDSDTRSLLGFMSGHFRAAYEGDPGVVFRVPDRDVSSAVPLPFQGGDVDRWHGRCRSGDGCSKRAVRGRFGPMWCDEHADVLEGLAAELEGGRPFSGSIAA